MLAACRPWCWAGDPNLREVCAHQPARAAESASQWLQYPKVNKIYSSSLSWASQHIKGRNLSSNYPLLLVGERANDQVGIQCWRTHGGACWGGGGGVGGACSGRALYAAVPAGEGLPRGL